MAKLELLWLLSTLNHVTHYDAADRQSYILGCKFSSWHTETMECFQLQNSQCIYSKIKSIALKYVCSETMTSK